MNREQALDILVKHSQFFELYVQSKYVPRAMEGTINEVLAAYNVINPQYKHCPGCNDPYFIIDANRYRLERIKQLAMQDMKEPVKMSFPKHKKK